MKRKILVSAVLSVLLLAALAANVHATEVKITASDGAADDKFGRSVAISGDYAVVGALLDDDAGAGSGSAYIFKRDGTAWAEQDKITARDGAAGDQFSYSVAISGDYVIVGARGDDDAGSWSGSAYIFKRDGTEWTEQAKITASDGAENDLFGTSVAISGDYVIVGAYCDDYAGSQSGSVYIFKRDGTAWTEQAKITASDGTEGDCFGISVAISGDYAVVGAYADGSAYIFKRNGTEWTEQAKITASDGTASDYFGVSVAISGDYAVVGAYFDDDSGMDSGSAYVFKYNGTVWVEQAKITASDGTADDRFGYSVAISGDYAVVGAYGDCDVGLYTGSSYIFKRYGTAWTEHDKTTASDGAAGGGFGYSVAISGDYVVVGAPWDDGAGSASGSAYIYDIPIRILFSCDSDGNPRDQFAPGETVYVTGNSLPASTSYTLWIQDEAVSEGDPLNTSEDPSGAQELVSSDTSGTLPVTAIWAIDPCAAVTYTEYDIVADNQATGVVGTYHASSDLLDSSSVAGFASIPDTTAPASITSLDGATYEQTYINWTWTDPADADFSKVMMYLDGIYKEDVLKGVQCYNTTGLTTDTEHEIATRTVDTAGNINATWVNDTARATEVKITASDGAADDWFGYSVAISGDYAVVGAGGDDADSGSAYIFKRDATEWTEQAKITASDGAASDHFGYSVAISGDYAIVGSHEDNAAGMDSGSAYIFKRDATEWTEQTKITASDGAASDHFGYSVAISGDYAIVGAYLDDDAGMDSGSAYIFKHDGTTWTEQAKITASDYAAIDYFGYSVAISGDYAVVGSHGDNAAGTDSGSAYIFKRDGTEWTQEAKITASDGAAYDEFGYSVAISRDYVVMGAGGDGAASGSAYIFKRDATEWTEQDKITASDGAADDRFGYSVAISGDYAVVGAYFDDDAGTDSGSSYVFKYNGTVWAEQAKITASDDAIYDYFGYSVAISGDYAVVGAYGDDDAGSDSGSAYIYDILIGIFSCDSDGNPKDQFAPGETVCVTGNNLIASTSYKLWIQDEAVCDGDALATGEDPSPDGQESVDTDASGTLPVTVIWAIDPCAAVTYAEYDIVADNQVAGVIGTYHASSDLLDSASTAGFVAPVPGTYVFTTTDAMIALQIAVGSRPSDLCRDVSGDGSVTSLDALMILQMAAGSRGSVRLKYHG